MTMAATKPNDTEGVNQYIANLPLEQQIALERVRQIIKNTVPEAVEFISYKMPAYHFHGMIGGFAAFKNHCSFFPWNAKTIEDFASELKDFKPQRVLFNSHPKNQFRKHYFKKYCAIVLRVI
jgi:uncharacterized protein YdhG (YjbR/CyaY superfamily)